MYLPKHQYEFIEQSKLEGIEGLVDQAGNLINGSKEVVLTSGGRIFDKLGIDFDKERKTDYAIVEYDPKGNTVLNIYNSVNMIADGKLYDVIKVETTYYMEEILK